jgi:hypothetical protein
MEKEGHRHDLNITVFGLNERQEKRGETMVFSKL